MQKTIDFENLSDEDKKILYAFLKQSTTEKFYSEASLKQLEPQEKDWKHSNEKTSLPYILRDESLGNHHLIFSQNIYRVIDNEGRFTNQFVVTSGKPSYKKRERSKGLKVLLTFSLDDDNHIINVNKSGARQLKIQKEALKRKADRPEKQKNALTVAKAYQQFSDCGALLFAHQPQGLFKSKMLIPYYPGANLEDKHLCSILALLKKPETEDPAIGHALMQWVTQLSKLHELGFVHCDLKLENLLYSVVNSKASIIDLDLSCKTGFMHQGAPGNPETMAPELLDRYIEIEEKKRLPEVEIMPAIDLYSLGIVFLKLLTQDISANLESVKYKFYQIALAEEVNALNFIKFDELQFFPGYCFDEKQTSLLTEIVIGLTKHEATKRMSLADVKQKLTEAFPYLADTIENSHEAKGMRP